MAKYILLILTSVFILSCGSTNTDTETSTTDSTDTNINTLVSDINWEGEEEEVEKPKKNHSSRSEHRGGGGGGVADNDVDVFKYQNFERSGDSPSDYANAIIFHAIRMVYSDNFAKPQASVLNSEKVDNRYSIELEIRWKDHWTPKYMIEGVLEVNSDGSNAKFTITNKNIEAEVLELTEDSFKSVINIPSI